MNAMTWFDHETQSIWSQPWGRGIKGHYKGVQLNLLPFQLTTWEKWVDAHPDTQVMTNDTEYVGLSRQGFYEEFVIGLVLGLDSKAYYFSDVENAGVINDSLGKFPIAIWAQDEIYQAYIRIVDDQILTFTYDGVNLIDEETASKWDPNLGLAVSGPLAGKSLQPVPSLSSYDWAWEDFYPTSEFYEP